MARLIQTQDIVDLIVDHLADAIHQELHNWTPDPEFRLTYPVSTTLYHIKQCALISKAFTPRAQKYLFSTLKIWAERVPGSPGGALAGTEPVLAARPRRAINNLLRIFEYKPYLAKHLHTLEIVERFKIGDGVEGHHNAPLTELLDILQSYGNPRDLVLVAYRQTEQPGYGIQESIATHLQSLKCVSLDVIPILMFSKSAELCSLLELNSSSCSGRSIGAFDMTAASPRAKLKRLTLSSSWTALGSILRGDGAGRPALDFSGLNYLRLTPTTIDEDVLYGQQVLFIAGPSLQTLDMSTHLSDPQSYSRPLDISPCTKLHTIKLLAIIHKNDSSDFDRLLDTLSTIACPDTFKNLHLELWISIDMNNWRGAHGYLKWEAVDEELYRISDRVRASESIPVPLSHDGESRRAAFTIDFVFFGNDKLEGGAYRDPDVDIRECQEFVDDLVGCRFPLIVAASESIKFEVMHTYSIDYSTSSCYGSEQG